MSTAMLNKPDTETREEEVLRTRPRRRAGATPRAREPVRPLTPSASPRSHSHRAQPTAPVRAESLSPSEGGIDVSLPVLFVLTGFLVGGALVLLCALDLLLAVPFSRASTVFDIGFMISGAILLYLSWDAREGCR